MNIDEKMSAGMKQYLGIKEQYKDCILFYRLGDFYEMFFEDAELVSKELDITLTGKDCGLEQRAPMCGVPHHAYEGYAQKLIERGYKIAICEQTDKIVDKVMQREVVRVITPGTVIDTSMLNDSSNTYFMCLFLKGSTLAYSYSDISTGDVITPKEIQYSFKLMLEERSVDVLAYNVETFEEVQNDVGMQKLWGSYQKKFSYAAEIAWEDVMRAVKEVYGMCLSNWG